MSAKVNKLLTVALLRCHEIKPSSLAQFLGALLDEEPGQLARLPGAPGTVPAAQFTCYAKQSVDLQEVLARDSQNARRLADMIWHLGKPQAQPSDNPTTVQAQSQRQAEDATCDPHSYPDCKRTAACAAAGR